LTRSDSATTGRATPRPVVKRRKRRTRIELAILLGPALVLYLVFVVFPIVQAGHYSLYSWNGIEALDNFVGLANYREAFADPAFRGAIEHNAILVALSLIVQFPLALGVALMLNQPLRGRSLLRTIFFAPYVLSEAITGVIWLLILQPDGLADAFLRDLGLGGLVQLWLADLNVVLYTMFVVITWKYVGFGIILFLAGLQGVPPELHEAASIDGASAWETLRHVTLPLLGPTIRIWAFLTVIGSIQLFDLIWIVTDGGPADASNTMATYMVDHGFRRYEFGYGGAVAVILFAISFVVSLGYQRFVLRRDTQGGVTRMAG
jgi:raffinose/stachyose/melibiose transport system permease protein